MKAENNDLQMKLLKDISWIQNLFYILSGTVVCLYISKNMQLKENKSKKRSQILSEVLMSRRIRKTPLNLIRIYTQYPIGLRKQT